jgi:hypothetical protein
MSTTNKVNPFYISNQDDDDEWGDGDDWDEEEILPYQHGQNDHHPLMSSTDRPQQQYNNGTEKQSYNQQQHERRTFDSYGNPHNQYQHQIQYWKYVLLIGVIFGAIFFMNNGVNHQSDADYISLIDEIPNDEYTVVIVGERHSGTSWIQARVQECFPHSTVKTALARPGYFFQYSENDDSSDDDDNDTTKSTPNKRPKKSKHRYQNQDTIVIHVTLNIYDWLEQMRLSPEYSPNHAGRHDEGHMVPLLWKDFLSKPWTLDTGRPERDLPFKNSTGNVCQLGFTYDQVISCVENPLAGPFDNPIYELKEDGTPYGSIIDLRAAKIQNHQSIQRETFVKKFITIPYEHAAREFKIKIVEEIQNFAKWTPSCSGDVIPPLLDKSNGMSLQYVSYVTERTDWSIEYDVGYTPMTKEEVESKGIQEERNETASIAEETNKSNEENNKQNSKPTDKPVVSNDDDDDKKANGDNNASKKPDDKDDENSKKTDQMNKENDDDKASDNSETDVDSSREKPTENENSDESSNRPTEKPDNSSKETTTTTTSKETKNDDKSSTNEPKNDESTKGPDKTESKSQKEDESSKSEGDGSGSNDGNRRS